MKSLQYIAVIVLCLSVVTGRAQDKKLEFEIGGGYGLSGITGKIENGSITPGMGGRFSIGAKYFFSEKIGIGFDCSIAKYNGTAKLSDYSAAIASTDDEEESFEYRVVASGIAEDIHFLAAEPALYLAYRQKISDKLGIYGKLGIKASVFLSAAYQCKAGTLETRGYYPAYNVELYELPNHGFDKVEHISYSGNLETSVLNSAFMDAGITIPVGKIGLNIGVYGSYGLNPVLEPEINQLMIYPMKYQSVTSLLDKVSLLSGGLKMGIQF